MNNKQFITRSGRLRLCMINIRNYVSKLIAPTDQVIFKKFSISRFHNPSAVRWTVKSIPFRLFSISNEIPTNSHWVQFLFLWIINSHFRRASPNTHMSQTQFPTFQQLKWCFWTTLVGTRFNIYKAVLSTSVHKNLGSFELLSILLTMSNKVQFLLSATPFWF